MKTILAIGVVLLCAQPTGAAFFSHCKNATEMNELLDTFNLFRIGFAKYYNVSNVQELKYDPSLQKEAEKLKSCEDLKKPGANYRTDTFTSDESYRVMKSFVAKTSKVKLDHGYFEYRHPLQSGFLICYSTIECYEKIFEEALPLVSITEANRTEFILFGPVGTYKESDLKYGPPGSQCPNGKAKSGLCNQYTVEEFNKKFGKVDDVDNRVGDVSREPLNKSEGILNSIYWILSVSIGVMFM